MTSEPYRGGRAGKYTAWTEFLANQGTGREAVELSFAELQALLGHPLPASAREYRPWWGNQVENAGRAQARGWMDAGFRVDSVDLQRERVRFVRSGAPRVVPLEPCEVPGEASSAEGQAPLPSPKSGAVFYLVSCVGQKLSRAAKAKDLYASDWFVKARAYVESRGHPWFILSAEHGLLDPEAVIAPYERTLKTMGVSERRAWAKRVIGQMDGVLPLCGRIVLLAGARYREFLMQYLLRRADRVEIPMEGLGIGEQKSWLGSHLHEKPRS